MHSFPYSYTIDSSSQFVKLAKFQLITPSQAGLARCRVRPNLVPHLLAVQWRAIRGGRSSGTYCDGCPWRRGRRQRQSAAASVLAARGRTAPPLIWGLVCRCAVYPSRPGWKRSLSCGLFKHLPRSYISVRCVLAKQKKRRHLVLAWSFWALRGWWVPSEKTAGPRSVDPRRPQLNLGMRRF